MGVLFDVFRQESNLQRLLCTTNWNLWADAYLHQQKRPADGWSFSYFRLDEFADEVRGLHDVDDDVRVGPLHDFHRVVELVAGDAFDDETIKGRVETAAFTQKRQYKNDWLTTFEYTPGSGEYFITHTGCQVTVKK